MPRTKLAIRGAKRIYDQFDCKSLAEEGSFTINHFRMKSNHFLLCLLLAMTTACTGSPAQKAASPASDGAFHNYWYNNEAELTSYQLEQARYGELRQADTVLIFVTEHFSKKKQVKADKPGPGDYSVLKLNMEKKFAPTPAVHPCGPNPTPGSESAM